MAQNIHQEVTIPASIEEVYAFFTDAGRFGEVTGAPAEIDPLPGGAFALFGGMIEGRTLERVEATRVVQAWRPKPWEPGVFSLVRFELKSADEETIVVLDHTSIPEGQYEHLSEGWHQNYWGKLKTHFGKKE